MTYVKILWHVLLRAMFGHQDRSVPITLYIRTVQHAGQQATGSTAVSCPAVKYCQLSLPFRLFCALTDRNEHESIWYSHSGFASLPSPIVQTYCFEPSCHPALELHDGPAAAVAIILEARQPLVRRPEHPSPEIL